jgi:pyruvate kinase
MVITGVFSQKLASALEGRRGLLTARLASYDVAVKKSRKCAMYSDVGPYLAQLRQITHTSVRSYRRARHQSTVKRDHRHVIVSVGDLAINSGHTNSLPV